MTAVHRVSRKPQDLEAQIDEMLWRAHMILIRAAQRAERRRLTEPGPLGEGDEVTGGAAEQEKR
jgi:hypothetical protein